MALWGLQLPGVLCCGFPHLSKRWPGAPPQPCLVARPGQRPGCPQENKYKRGDVGTLCCSSCAGQQSHGVILGWLLRVGALTPAHGRIGSCPHRCCHTLLCLSIPQEPHSWFFLQWEKLFPPMTGLMCLNVPYVFPENPPQDMEH